MFNYVVLVVSGYWATFELCKHINFTTYTKIKNVFVILQTK